MNATRLKMIDDCLTSIQEAHDNLAEVLEEEEEAYDNLPESMQFGERGEIMEEAISNLEEAVSTLDEVISNLEEVTDCGSNPDAMEYYPWEMLQVGDDVKHKSFGLGYIKSIEGKYYTVCFEAKTAKFIFPDAIENGFISIEF